MNPLLAQIAAAAAESTATATNRVGPLVSASQGFVQRFEEATGLPREVALWSVNIIVALLLLVLGYMGAGLARSIIRKVFAKRNLDTTISGFIGNLVHALIMAFVIV